MNHTSSLRYAVAGEIPVSSASWRIRRGGHERGEGHKKIIFKEENCTILRVTNLKLGLLLNFSSFP